MLGKGKRTKKKGTGARALFPVVIFFYFKTVILFFCKKKNRTFNRIADLSANGFFFCFFSRVSLSLFILFIFSVFFSSPTQIKNNNHYVWCFCFIFNRNIYSELIILVYYMYNYSELIILI